MDRRGWDNRLASRWRKNTPDDPWPGGVGRSWSGRSTSSFSYCSWWWFLLARCWLWLWLCNRFCLFSSHDVPSYYVPTHASAGKARPKWWSARRRPESSLRISTIFTRRRTWLPIILLCSVTTVASSSRSSQCYQNQSVIESRFNFQL